MVISALGVCAVPYPKPSTSSQRYLATHSVTPQILYDLTRGRLCQGQAALL